MSESLTVRDATADDRAAVEDLLARNSLPTDGLRSADVRVVVGVLEEDVICAGGLEPAGDAGLLRSVVVDAEHRNRGYGGRVCDELESLARDRELDALYLLTETASDYFRDRGYEPIERTTAPPAIRETDEFASLCPGGAVCMRKRLC
jgi:amino-acid N-acetyltransferase